MFDPRSLELYVVTCGTLGAGPGHRAIARAAIEGGATAVQLRPPELGDDALEPLARELAGLCRDAGVLFIVNDRPDVAVRVGAGGAHVGQGDDPSAARELLGPAMVLGISVRDADQGRAAAAAGADYLGVTVWRTSTKPEAVPGGLRLITAVSEASGLPVVGIGGIDAANATEVMAAGAAGVAVISAVASAEDPVAATRELRAVIEAYRDRPRARA